MDSLDAVADALYAEDPSAFVALRDVAAAEARATGDRPLATAIGRLRRPTLSAWAVNLLSRHATADLAGLLDLGEALAAAQESLDGADLRRLSTERHRAVHALARRASTLAADRGRPLSEAVRDEVAGTLQAALADPEVGALVRSGRLDRARAYSGFGPGTGSTVARGSRSASTTVPATARDSTATRGPDRAALMRARTRVVEAEAALATTKEQLRSAAETASAAWERVDRAGQEVADLRAELAAAERALADARGRAETTDHVRDEAHAARDERSLALARARDDLAAHEPKTP